MSITETPSQLKTLNAPAMSALDGVAHGFFTRQGGVSSGIYAGLNCGAGSRDDAAHVRENRDRAKAHFGPEATTLLTAYQIHSPTVAVVDAPWADTDAPQADAMVTCRADIVLGILTADCTPVLFADRDAGVIGAAHAGWKGAKAGVLAATVEAMVELGAKTSNIHAAIGPTIQQVSYEVGDDFRDAFLADDGTHETFFAPGTRAGHCQFDLPGFAKAGLQGLGLAMVEVIGADTCADAERFYSYRRSCLQGESDYGRGLSAITLAGAGR